MKSVSNLSKLRECLESEWEWVLWFLVSLVNAKDTLETSYPTTKQDDTKLFVLCSDDHSTDVYLKCFERRGWRLSVNDDVELLTNSFMSWLRHRHDVFRSFPPKTMSQKLKTLGMLTKTTKLYHSTFFKPGFNWLLILNISSKLSDAFESCKKKMERR